MQTALPEKIPLTDDEKDWLMTIYNKRFKYLLIAFPGYTLILTMLSFGGLGLRVYAIVNDLILSGNDTWLAGNGFSAGWYYKMDIAAFISFIFCVLSYFNRMLPYKMDADSGVKMRMPFLVVKKEYFPVTQQYFVWLGGVNDRHYEVDQDTYNKCEEGGTVFMSMAIKSKYIFSEDDEFMPFSF